MRHLLTSRFYTLLLCIQLMCCAQAFADTPRAENGVLDLREWNFDQDGTLELNGQWEFIWQEFQIAKAAQSHFESLAFLELPGTWLGQGHRDQTLGVNGYATLRLKVLLSERPIDLGIRVKRGQSAFRLYVNGEEMMDVGEIGRSHEEETPRRTRHIATIRDAHGDLEITIQLSNFDSFNGGGFLSPITLGEAKRQANHHLAEYTRDIVLVGAFACLGLFLMILHLRKRRRDASYLVLYLIAFVAAIHLLTVNATLLELFPRASWFWNERVAYLSAGLVVALIYEFVRQLYPQQMNTRASIASMTMATILSIFIIVWPGPLPAEIPLALAVLTLLVLFAGSIGLGKTIRDRVSGTTPVVAGVAVLVLAGLNDMLMLAGLISSVYLAPYGILVMLFLFAFNLAAKVDTALLRNELLAAAIENSNECVALYDAEDRLVYCNESSRQFFGEEHQDILKVGVKYEDLVRAYAYSGEFEGQEESYISERMEKHRHPGSTVEMQQNGRWYLHRESITPNGGSIELLTDISAQKEREAELGSALSELEKANRSKTEFLSNMSHELRTPLNAILGFSEMMMTPELNVSGERQQEFSELIHSAGQQLLGLVNDVLDLTRIESGKIELNREHVDLDETLTSCLAIVQVQAMKAEVETSFVVQENLPALHADSLRLQQIVIILLDNAIKFTEAGGKVEVIAQLNKAGGISVTVSDTGIGIGEEDLTAVLEKFGQARGGPMTTHAGLGLGLAIAEQLMVQHGGQIEIQSELGTGTVVTVSFPPEKGLALRA